jgi:hypothetical protein
LSKPTRSWKDVISEKPVNEARAGLYEHVMEAQHRIAQTRYSQGVGNEIVLSALDEADERLSDDERREDLYLSLLGHYVTALGGRLEVRAVFGDQEIVVRRMPGD